MINLKGYYNEEGNVIALIEFDGNVYFTFAVSNNSEIRVLTQGQIIPDGYQEIEVNELQFFLPIVNILGTNGVSNEHLFIANEIMYYVNSF